MHKTDEKTKNVMFWSRITREKSQEWILTPGRDGSRVPLKTWKAFNKAFWKWKTDGLLWPLDELDAYQFAAGELVRTAEAAETMALESASTATYLVATAFTLLMKYRERQVCPARARYRDVFEQARLPEGPADGASRGEDASDREWADATAAAFDAHAFVESLPGTSCFDRANAARLARACVRATLSRLDADAQRGLRAWLAADGVWRDAALIYNPNGSVQGYVYRF